MKRATNSYRLQIIKEVAVKQERLKGGDPMANYIQDLLDHHPEGMKKDVEYNQHFAGSHFDEHVGGWISDRWSLK